MRVIFTSLLLLAAASVPGAAQSGGDDFQIGGYNGTVFRATSIAGTGAILFGNTGGTTFGGHYTFGGGGYTLVQTFDADNGLTMSYGGFGMEYSSTFGRDFFYSAGILIGGGSARVDGASTGLFVADGTGIVGYEVLPFFRIGIGGSYRLVAGGSLPAYSSADLSGAGAGIHFLFGRF